MPKLKNKSIVQSTLLNYTVANVEPQPVIPFDKYSDVNRLINVTTNIFKIRNKLKHVDLDPNSCAKIYLLKIMQQQSFPTELAYLQSPQGKEVPELLKNLNLFVDESGMIRTKARIGKITTYDYEVINLVLLAKDHNLTELMIVEYHKRCKHL